LTKVKFDAPANAGADEASMSAAMTSLDMRAGYTPARIRLKREFAYIKRR
jgi:hypothetical protein